MAFFWVNLGTSYKEVRKHNFMWAPAHTYHRSGKQIANAGWDSVKEVKAGDVIFCNRDGNLIYVAVARKDAHPAKRPATQVFQHWVEDGTQIDVELTILEPTVSVADFKMTLMEIHNRECRPALFAKNGGLSQQFMVRLPEGAGALILSHIGDAEVEVCEHAAAQKQGRLTQGGTRDTVAKARIGQGQFREQVLSLWRNSCPVTGLKKPALLIAGHIVPWSLSNETEKIDPNNGFPIDRLFDRGYVSFSDSGQLMIKISALNEDELVRLGIHPSAKISGLNAQQKAYLARHRQLNHFPE